MQRTSFTGIAEGGILDLVEGAGAVMRGIARRVRLALGPELNKTDRWGRYIPEAGDDDGVAVPPEAEELLVKPVRGNRGWSEDFWPELRPETPEEVYRHDMARRLREADRLGQEVWTVPVSYDPGQSPTCLWLPDDPTRDTADLLSAGANPADLYRNYPRMPRTPIKRGDNALLDLNRPAIIGVNEGASFSGPHYEEAIKTVLGNIINSDEQLGAGRPKTGKDYLTRPLSPSEREVLEDIRYRLIPEVLTERSQVFDRALGATHFNFQNIRRYSDDPKKMLGSIWHITNSTPRFLIDPLDNSYPRSHVDSDGLDAAGVYANFYNENRR